MRKVIHKYSLLYLSFSEFQYLCVLFSIFLSDFFMCVFLFPFRFFWILKLFSSLIFLLDLLIRNFLLHVFFFPNFFQDFDHITPQNIEKNIYIWLFLLLKNLFLIVFESCFLIFLFLSWMAFLSWKFSGNNLHCIVEFWWNKKGSFVWDISYY